MITGGFRLGMDLGGTKLESVLFDATDAAVWRDRVATPAGDYAATVRALAAHVAQARAVAQQRVPGAMPSVGIGTPGATAADGRMKNCNSTCLNGQPLQADIEAAIGQSVRLANDANCFALSEATDGAGAGAAVVFGVIVGTGVGGGIVVHGRVLPGANGIAGEWGHNPLPWWDAARDPDTACYCGRRCCIESLLSGPALAQDHARLHGGTLDARAIAARAAGGDPACTATLDRHAERLARALAGVINLLDPDVIVLGGGLSHLQHLYDRLPALWPRWVVSAGSTEALRTRLLPAHHGDASGVRGAAWLWPRS